MEQTRETLSQSFIEKLSQVMRKMHKNHNFIWGDFKLSKPQIAILFFINKNDKSVSVKDISTFLGVTPGAITHFIDVLVDNKLVRRDEDLSDRRVVKVSLTDYSIERFNEFKKDYYKSTIKYLNNISDKEMIEVIKVLDKIKVD
jgi:DNA-binding MarR family transcriptional regulator